MASRLPQRELKAALNTQRDQIVEQLLERIEKTETTLLKELRKWGD